MVGGVNSKLRVGYRTGVDLVGISLIRWSLGLNRFMRQFMRAALMSFLASACASSIAKIFEIRKLRRKRKDLRVLRGNGARKHYEHSQRTDRENSKLRTFLATKIKILVSHVVRISQH
jgi:hypothetical protein